MLLIFISSGQATALHPAAEEGHTQACQLLIDAKADVNATDECAFVFEICCIFCVVLCFWNLLLIFITSYQDTALHRACRSYDASNGHMEACQLMIDAKADVNATDRCVFKLENCGLFCVALC